MNKTVHHNADVPQFCFYSGSTPIDWSILSMIDTTRLTNSQYSGGVDVYTLQRVIDLVGYAQLTTEETAAFTPEHATHLFLLCQLIIQYLVFSQEQLVKLNASLNERVSSLLDTRTNTTEALQELEARNVALTKELKGMKRTLMAYEFNKMYGNNNAGVFNKGSSDALPAPHRCIYCAASYLKEESLISHLRKRHPSGGPPADTQQQVYQYTPRPPPMMAAPPQPIPIAQYQYPSPMGYAAAGIPEDTVVRRLRMEVEDLHSQLRVERERSLRSNMAAPTTISVPPPIVPDTSAISAWTRFQQQQITQSNPNEMGFEGSGGSRLAAIETLLMDISDKITKGGGNSSSPGLSTNDRVAPHAPSTSNDSLNSGGEKHYATPKPPPWLSRLSNAVSQQQNIINAAAANSTFPSLDHSTVTDLNKAAQPSTPIIIPRAPVSDNADLKETKEGTSEAPPTVTETTTSEDHSSAPPAAVPTTPADPLSNAKEESAPPTTDTIAVPLSEPTVIATADAVTAPPLSIYANAKISSNFNSLESSIDKPPDAPDSVAAAIEVVPSIAPGGLIPTASDGPPVVPVQPQPTVTQILEVSHAESIPNASAPAGLPLAFVTTEDPQKSLTLSNNDAALTTSFAQPIPTHAPIVLPADFTFAFPQIDGGDVMVAAAPAPIAPTFSSEAVQGEPTTTKVTSTRPRRDSSSSSSTRKRKKSRDKKKRHRMSFLSSSSSESFSSSSSSSDITVSSTSSEDYERRKKRSRSHGSSRRKRSHR